MIHKINCVSCNHELFYYETNRQPIEGDFIICIYCLSVMNFDKNLKPIEPKEIPNSIKLNVSMFKLLKETGVDIGSLFKNYKSYMSKLH